MDILSNYNIIDTIEHSIVTELSKQYLVGDVEISTSPTSLYIRIKNSDVIFSFILNNSNKNLLYSNSYKERKVNIETAKNNICKEIIKAIISEQAIMNVS